MTIKRASYHHGDLHPALLAAGEAVLAETGLDGFSLRKVAARVGVSHSAPAHHFGDARGLLAALATRGFERLLQAMRDRQAQAPADPMEQLIASGQGYVDFAVASPALFRLIFGSELASDCSAELEAASTAALGHLAADLGRLRGGAAFDHDGAMDEVLACWSLTHGFAELLISGRMKPVQILSTDERAALFRRIFAQKLRLPDQSRI